MSTVNPDDYMMVSDVLEQMYEAEIPWPDHLYVMSNRIDLRYDLENAD